MIDRGFVPQFWYYPLTLKVNRVAQCFKLLDISFSFHFFLKKKSCHSWSNKMYTNELLWFIVTCTLYNNYKIVRTITLRNKITLTIINIVKVIKVSTDKRYKSSVILIERATATKMGLGIITMITMTDRQEYENILNLFR